MNPNEAEAYALGWSGEMLPWWLRQYRAAYDQAKRERQQTYDAYITDISKP